jgi:hypothetical protein
MDLRHVCYFVAEALKLVGGTLLGEAAGAVQAEVVALAKETGTVLLTVECRQYELVVAERKRRPTGRADCGITEAKGEGDDCSGPVPSTLEDAPPQVGE